MATVNLEPSSTVSNNWIITSGDGTAHGVLSDSADSSHITVGAQGKVCIVQLDDYSSGGTITSIRFYVRGVLFNTRSGNTDIQVILENSSGTALYTETVTLNFTAGYANEDHYGTARTTSDGSSAWTDADLDGLRLNINTSPEDPPAISKALVSKASVEVTYSTGYTHSVMGVASGDISTVKGVATANIDEVMGV
tara:strand:- start:134 stop:718 length:585 start_codon:yes stop_codon:yes gene_type:complete